MSTETQAKAQTPAGGASPGDNQNKGASEAGKGKAAEGTGTKPKAGTGATTPTPAGELTTERLQESLRQSLAPSGAAKPTGVGATPPAGAGGEEGQGADGGAANAPDGAGTDGGDGGGNEPSPGAGTPEGEGEGDQSQKGLIDAVTALRAERRELRAENEKLIGRLEALEAKFEAPAPGGAAKAPNGAGADGGAAATDPALFDPEVQQVVNQEQGQRDLKHWAATQLGLLANKPEAVVAEIKRRGIALPDENPEVVQDWLETVKANATATLEELIVERRAAVTVARQRATQVQAETGEVATAILPERADATSDRAKLFEHVMRNNPGLRHTPDGEMRASVQVLGIEAAMAALKAQGKDPVKVLKLDKLGLSGKAPVRAANGANGQANGKAVPRTPTTRLPGAPVSVAGSGATSEPNSRDLYKKFQENPTEENKQAWMRASVTASVH